MNINVKVSGNNIGVELKMHLIRIQNDEALAAILKTDAEKFTNELVNRIKVEYYKVFNVDLNVSNDSMAVEIWAHVYAEKFADAIKNFSSVKLIDAFADKIIKHANKIDIGEKRHDENRFVWDGLSVFKSAMASVLFGKQEK